MQIDQQKRRRGVARLVFAAVAIVFILGVDWAVSDRVELHTRHVISQVLLATLWAVPFLHGFTLVVLSVRSGSALHDAYYFGVIVTFGASSIALLAFSIYKIVFGVEATRPDPAFIVDLLCSVSMLLLALSYTQNARRKSGERTLALVGTAILLAIAGSKVVRIVMHISNYPDKIWAPSVRDVEGPVWSTFILGQFLLTPAFLFEFVRRHEGVGVGAKNPIGGPTPPSGSDDEAHPPSEQR